MINCNRRDGSARALNELAERIAVKHEVHLFARRVEEIDLSHIKVAQDGRDYPGRRSSILRATISWRNLCSRSAASISSIRSDLTPRRPMSSRFHKSSRLKAKSSPNNRSRAGFQSSAQIYSLAPSRGQQFRRKKVLYSASGLGRRFFCPVREESKKNSASTMTLAHAPVRVVPNAADTKVFKPIQESERQMWRRGQWVSPGGHYT